MTHALVVRFVDSDELRAWKHRKKLASMVLAWNSKFGINTTLVVLEMGNFTQLKFFPFPIQHSWQISLLLMLLHIRTYVVCPRKRDQYIMFAKMASLPRLVSYCFNQKKARPVL